MGQRPVPLLSLFGLKTPKPSPLSLSRAASRPAQATNPFSAAAQAPAAAHERSSPIPSLFFPPRVDPAPRVADASGPLVSRPSILQPRVGCGLDCVPTDSPNPPCNLLTIRLVPHAYAPIKLQAPFPDLLFPSLWRRFTLAQLASTAATA